MEPSSEGVRHRAVHATALQYSSSFDRTRPRRGNRTFALVVVWRAATHTARYITPAARSQTRERSCARRPAVWQLADPDCQVSASRRNQLCQRMQAQLAPSQRVARPAHRSHTAARAAARAPQLRAAGPSRSMQAALSSANGNGAHLAEHSERITQLEDELTAERHKARARRRKERPVLQLTRPPARCRSCNGSWLRCALRQHSCAMSASGQACSTSLSRSPAARASTPCALSSSATRRTSRTSFP